jgi:hypothetical protein
MTASERKNQEDYDLMMQRKGYLDAWGIVIDAARDAAKRSAEEAKTVLAVQRRLQEDYRSRYRPDRADKSQ